MSDLDDAIARIARGACVVREPDGWYISFRVTPVRFLVSYWDDELQAFLTYTALPRERYRTLLGPYPWRWWAERKLRTGSWIYG